MQLRTLPRKKIFCFQKNLTYFLCNGNGIRGSLAQSVRAPVLYAGGSGFESRVTHFVSVAQLAEHRTFNPGVAGPIPVRHTAVSFLDTAKAMGSGIEAVITRRS